MIRPGLQLARVAGRRMASTAAATGENEFIAKRQAMRDHAVQTTDLWRKISFFVCIPGIAVCALWTYKAEMAHKEHVAHEKEHGEERKVYEYMNMRTKVDEGGGKGEERQSKKVDITGRMEVAGSAHAVDAMETEEEVVVVRITGKNAEVEDGRDRLQSWGMQTLFFNPEVNIAAGEE